MLAALNGEVIYRNITELPSHEYLKIEANFFFLSPFWNGEEAMIKIDNKIVWLDRHNWKENEKNLCIMDENRLKDYQWNYPLNIVVKHNKENAFIEILSSKVIDKLQCLKKNVAVFGFDDFNLYIK